MGQLILIRLVHDFASFDQAFCLELTLPCKSGEKRIAPSYVTRCETHWKCSCSNFADLVKVWWL